MASPSVIQILVTSGDPDGVRVVEKSNWTGRGVMFARADLGAAQEQGLSSPGAYVLLGDDPDGEHARQIYVGQGDDLGKRLQQHQRDDNKDFWDTTIVFLSGNQSLNRAHVSLLEAELIRLARGAGRARLANGNQPSAPHMPAADHAVAAGFLDEMRAIFPVLGVDAFEAPEPKSPIRSDTIRFFLDSGGGKGEGEERSDGFLVFAGAIARLDETPSLAARRQAATVSAVAWSPVGGWHSRATTMSSPTTPCSRRRRQPPACSPVLPSTAARVGVTPAE